VRESADVSVIAGVTTSTTAFVGRAERGPVNVATEIRSFAEYTALFGGLAMLSPMSFSVSHYFANGGQTAVIVRVVHADSAASAEVMAASTGSTGGSDGGPIEDADVDDAAGRAGKRGMYALEDCDLFNLLVIPPYDMTTDVGVATWASAAAYCRSRRAFLIVDPPLASFTPPATAASSGLAALTAALPPSSPDAQHAAFFLPALRATNPLTNLPDTFAPSGAIAGVFARTDATRGVWKAAAGLEAGITGVLGLAYRLTEADSATLNRLGANALRTFDAAGTVIWGARTLQGEDTLVSDYKYIPVRRLALYLEESVIRGTQWALFEPNDEPLWAQIRLVVGGFMEDLFRQGAFRGTSSRDAYFVTCDRETTTQADVESGVVNILIGFAPSKPAEFVVIPIRRTARRPDA